MTDIPFKDIKGIKVCRQDENGCSEDDFKVVLDFNKINISAKKGEVVILKKPNDIIISELNKKIDFIIQ